MKGTVDINHDSFDSVDFLLNNSINNLTFEQKVDLKGKIARPKLDISQKGGKYIRTFQEKWYLKYRCLAGNKTKRTYHSYYCLISVRKIHGVKEGTSSDVQNDLIESVTIAINENIQKEINDATSVSIQTDETTDVSVKAQFSIIARYVHALQNELVNIYSSGKDKDKSFIELLAFTVDNELETVYEQTVKLLQLILSIPVSSTTTERSVST
ncbi:hypothetical protein ANN_17784 [Periplaneta americana]|uniref:DUF4371 domain-containing protein n=1 Tax=Periplaneta americana TaxID=6978 RepID=A0ABQ8STY7_PERAM|nr:hypothetical protein ANN_17784 [Periplaneta americana]